MIPVYICDDELPIRRSLEQIVSNQILILDSDMGPVRALEDPEKLLELQKQDSVPAIYFLDIDFPGRMSGLELAQKLRQYDPRGFIVFITAHNDLAFETFRLRRLTTILPLRPSACVWRPWITSSRAAATP